MISSYITTDNDNSIKYENLYSIKGVIYYLTLEDIKLPCVKKFTNAYDWVPTLMKFENEEELNAYIKSLEIEYIQLRNL